MGLKLRSINDERILSFIAWLEIERCRIDAVAQASRLGAIVEDMTQVSAASITGDLGADHAEAGVCFGMNGGVFGSSVKAGPARTRIIFCL